MPVVFVGHGSPMNAIEDNAWSRSFADFGRALPRPKSILSVSAHWYRPGTYVTGEERPKTIHDFGGFPPALYHVEYPAPGDRDLAARVVSRLKERAAPRFDWGLDHGTWSVLHHMWPAADIPVVQLSIDSTLAPSAHLDLARSLAPLRDEGVLVLGSGNITHNLRHAFTSARQGDLATPEWARRFDEDTARALEQHDAPALARALEGEDGRRAHPTPDHYLPLLYAAGAAAADDAVAFPTTGYDMGSLSMRAVRLG
jgi:4,5-DOPA dioxygenase extradiol